MGNTPRAARPIGPDGEYLWLIEEPHDYTLDQAAEAMARVHPTAVPTRCGRRTVVMALTADAEALSRPQPDAASVARYRAELDRHGLFASVAKVRKPGSPLTIRVNLPRYWDLRQAAAALALRHPQMPHKAGRRTAHHGLIHVTRNRADYPGQIEITDHRVKLTAAAAPEAGAVANWLDLLLAVEIFPVAAAMSTGAPIPTGIP